MFGYSKAGLALTEAFEGCKVVAYKDIAGIWTIGYGHTKGVHDGMVCTQAQAEQWLIDDTLECSNWINSHVVPHITLTQGEFDALVDFSFNLGLHSLAISTLLKDVLANKMELAATEFEKWDMAGGKHVAGILRRRVAEMQVFNGDCYEA